MNSDVLVVGGGLHGLSAALHLLRRGVSVIVAERHFVGRHASGATAAGVRTLGRHLAELPLSLEAAETWHRMDELVDDDCGFVGCGQLRVAEDEAALEALRVRVGNLQTKGFTHERIVGANEIRSLAPEIAPHCLGGAWAERDGSADPHRTIRAFRDAVLNAGGRIFEGCSVLNLKRLPTHWEATTSVGLVAADTVINAAGAWADEVAKLAGDPVQHAIRTSMMVVTERAAARINPVIASQGRALSLKQTAQGTLLLGGGSQGRLADDRQSASVDIAKLSAPLQTAVRLFPAIEGVRIVRTWAGMEAVTPDHLPVIGPSHRADGLFHVFGFSGHGFQLVPSVGRVMADMVCDGQSDHDLRDFDVRRVSINENTAPKDEPRYHQGATS